MSIAAAVAAATAYLGSHPDEARYRDAPAVARVADGLRVEVTGSGGESVATDMPRGIGGSASAPSPGWFLRAAIASCVASLIAIRAAATSVELRSVEVSVDSESDDRGILGMDESIPAGPLGVRIAVRLRPAAGDGAAIDELVAWAIDHCPVSEAVRRAVPIEVVSERS
jgi:uncharacterized OsmC-like protein